MLYRPRPYQLSAKGNLYAALRGGRNRALLVLQCGSGKTYVMFLVAVDALGKRRPVWALAARRDLVRQTAGKFVEYAQDAGLDIPVRVVMAGSDAGGFGGDGGWSGKIVVASIQTVLAREVAFPANAVCLLDEAHLAYADDLLAAAPQTQCWIGATATPARENGQPLGGLGWQVMVLGPTSSELQATDPPVLVAPEVTAPVPPQDRTLKEWLAEHEVIGDPVQAWRGVADGLRTLAFLSSVPEARDLTERYKAAGIRAVTLCAADSDEERAEVVRRLHDRELDVIATFGLFREGTDLPWLECLQDLAPTESYVTWKQRAARLHRFSLEARKKVHLDQSANIWRHGPPCADRTWTLEGGLVRRMSGPALTVCHACGYLRSASLFSCPRCGAKRSPLDREFETVDGEIERYTAATEAARQQRLADEERDRKRRKVLHGIAWKLWTRGRMFRRGDASALAARWWKEYRLGQTPWWEFVCSKEREVG